MAKAKAEVPPPEEEEAEIGTAPVPPCLAWTDLTMTETAEFMALTTPQETLTFIAEKFGLVDYERNARSAQIVDFYLWILSFTKDSGFNEEKASATFTILKNLHDFSVKYKQSVEQAYNEFKRLIVMHSLAGVEGSVQLFSSEDVTLLSAFVSRTYFQHYRLYQYAAVHEQEKDQHAVLLFVNTPTDPPALADAIIETKPDEAAAASGEKAEAGGEAENEEGGAEEGAEESEGDKQKRVSLAVAAMLEEKGKILQSELDEKLNIKMKTLSNKLAGLGV